jgi:hypothetical protein
MTTFPCPRCSKPLSPEGTLSIDGLECPLYQCDVCTVPWNFGGETFAAAYTFVVGPDGRPFDPAADDDAVM